jgi:ubiquinone/menaquinone biosynthesis C-methylase UbiE
MLSKIIPDYKGKKIFVPSSGDNHAVFAFALLGATVTSSDISPRQIENAEAIAKKYNWDIRFICDDTVNLSSIEDNMYDLVFTSNGVHVWIDDLMKMYKNINRVLKNNGKYLMYEIHPFDRPFSYDDVSNNTSLKIVKPYDDIGPHDLNYHWRVQDFLNAIINSGLNIRLIFRF